ncbi:FHA domain-containing protein [Nocardia aurea]|uniref:FHA domain-containing protein n=1 Tax=Nocardia aurea TaxID=2144174 RepID=UPI0033BC0BA7
MPDPQVEVLAGTHLVARSDGVLIVVANRDDVVPTPESAVGSTLLAIQGLIADAARQEQPRSGRTFARLATTWLMGQDDESAVEFGVVTPSDTGIAVFLHGAVTAVLMSGDQHREVLRGRDAGFTVDRVVIPAPDIGAGIFVDEGDQSVDLPRARGVCTLAAGAVPGSGAVLWYGEPAARPSRARMPATPDLAPPPDDEFDMTLAPGVPETRQTPPVPVRDRLRKSDPPSAPRREAETPLSDPRRARTAPRNPPTAGEVIVAGYRCARRHHNDPRVSFCTVCGIRMDQLTCVLTDGVRPPLGLLMLDDATSIILDGDCVLGREPEPSDAARRGAKPVRLDDISGGMSRTHAEIRLVDWDVTVVDCASANGTHIRQPGYQEWQRAIPGHPIVLQPGAQIQLGGRTLTFDSQRGQL